MHSKVKSANVKYVVISVARNEENLENMGKTLHEFSSSVKQRIAVVISGDLAHTHETSCTVPLYLPGNFGHLICFSR